jgi:predicted type IV restriction endonuclease
LIIEKMNFLENVLIPVSKGLVGAEEGFLITLTTFLDLTLEIIAEGEKQDIFEFRKKYRKVCLDTFKHQTVTVLCKGKKKDKTQCPHPAKTASGYCQRHSEQYEKDKRMELMKKAVESVQTRRIHSHIFRGEFKAGCSACEEMRAGHVLPCSSSSVDCGE